jgi:hypothetical protein
LGKKRKKEKRNFRKLKENALLNNIHYKQTKRSLFLADIKKTTGLK